MSDLDEKHAHLALDGLDLTILLALGYGTTLLLSLVPWQPPRLSFVGLLLAPVALGALQLRRRYFPSQRGPVEKKLTLLGVLATALLVIGVIAAAFGWSRFHDSLTLVPEPISEPEIRQEAERRATNSRLLEIANPIPLSPEEARQLEESGEVGNFEDLMAALDEPPPAATLTRFESEARLEMEHAQRESFETDRRRAREVAFRLGAFGLLAFGLGGLLDSRRARKSS